MRREPPHRAEDGGTAARGPWLRDKGCCALTWCSKLNRRRRSVPDRPEAQDAPRPRRPLARLHRAERNHPPHAAPQPLARRIAHRTLLVAYREALGLRNEVLALHLPAIAGLLAPGRPSATQHRGLCLARKLSALPSCVAALTPRVEPLLVADDPRLTVLAIECLGAFGIDRHSDAIARHLGSSHHTCRVAALTALAQSEQARASRKERRDGQTDRRRRMHAPRHARTRTRPSQPPRRLAPPMRRRSSRSSRTRTATTRRRRR